MVRQLLLDALAPGTVVWGANFIGYEEGVVGSNRALSVKFSIPSTGLQTTQTKPDNTFNNKDNKPTHYKIHEIGANVLVGADGIWSAVRRCKLKIPKSLPKEVNTRYLGVMVILGRASINHELTDCSQKKFVLFALLYVYIFFYYNCRYFCIESYLSHFA